MRSTDAFEQGHRYAFAMELARGRRVLDAACGDGQGAALLARTATSVLGVDACRDAIVAAEARHASPRLQFRHGDVAHLSGLSEGSVDLVVSFGALEGVDDHDGLLAVFARLLAPDGLLLVSMPDRHACGDPVDTGGPRRVRTLYREGFEALLSRHFARFRLYGQRYVAHSMLWRLDGGTGATTAYTQDGDEVFGGVRVLPTHHFAVCAKRGESLAGLPALSCFADAQRGATDPREAP